MRSCSTSACPGWRAPRCSSGCGAGRVVPRAELETTPWPHDLPDRDPLRGQVHLLRRTLSAAGFEGLETVHGVGWRLAIDAAR